MCVCMCGSVGDSVSVVALDTHHHPPSRQYSRWLFLSFSLSTSSLVLHHITKPALVASRCCSLLLFDLHLLHHSGCLTFVINQSINHSIILERDSMQHVSLSLSLLNEGIVVSDRERERERECCCCSLASREYVCVCYDTANSLSIVTLPTKHTMCVCVCVCVTLTLSALVEDRPCLVSKCAHATLHSSTTTNTNNNNNNTKHNLLLVLVI